MGVTDPRKNYELKLAGIGDCWKKGGRDVGMATEVSGMTHKFLI